MQKLPSGAVLHTCHTQPYFVLHYCASAGLSRLIIVLRLDLLSGLPKPISRPYNGHHNASRILFLFLRRRPPVMAWQMPGPLAAVSSSAHKSASSASKALLRPAPR